MTNTQDVQYMDVISIDNTANKQEDIALVMLKSGRLTGEDTGVKILDRQVENEFDQSSDDEPDFIEMNNATKKATKQVQLDNEPSEVIELDENEYQFVNQAINPIAKVKSS